jgi:nicotinamidase-related amidase
MQHAYGLDIPGTLDELCHPGRMALVVYDMQVGIVSQIADGAKITRRVVEVIDAARSRGFRILYTRHMYLPKEIAGATQLRTSMAWQRVTNVVDVKPHFLRDSPEFAIIPEISPLASEAVFDKITMSAFAATPLDIVLRDCGIGCFAIVGIALEIGIDPTVRHAMDLAYIPVIIADACGSGNQIAADRSLASLATFGGSLQTDTQTITSLLRGTEQSRENSLS